jgi:hypothetical protein
MRQFLPDTRRPKRNLWQGNKGRKKEARMKYYMIAKELRWTGRTAVTLNLLSKGGEAVIIEKKKEAEEMLTELVKNDPKGGWLLITVEEPIIEINVRVTLDEG